MTKADIVQAGTGGPDFTPKTWPLTRLPHRGDPIVLYGDRRTILDLIDPGSGLLVVADDDAGRRIERYADRLTWDDETRAWRAVG